MIDLITMARDALTEREINELVQKNDLQTIVKDGITYFDNEKIKFRDGFYLKVDTKNQRLKLECSMHKLYNYLSSGKQCKQLNYNLFSFSNARTCAELLSQETGIDVNKLNVCSYETGLNLNLNKDCKTYIDQLETIGRMESKKIFYVNPKYKGERIKTTSFHRDFKKTFKAYDKNYEIADKTRTIIDTGHPNILRIETTQRRVEKMKLGDLLNPDFTKRLSDQFLRDWRTVQFSPVIIAPRGSHRTKIDTCKQIILFEKDFANAKANDQLNNGNLTIRQFEAKIHFIKNEFDSYKEKLKIFKSEDEMEFREKLNKAIEVVKI